MPTLAAHSALTRNQSGHPKIGAKFTCPWAWMRANNIAVILAGLEIRSQGDSIECLQGTEHSLGEA